MCISNLEMYISSLKMYISSLDMKFSPYFGNFSNGFRDFFHGLSSFVLQAEHRILVGSRLTKATSTYTAQPPGTVTENMSSHSPLT